MYTNLPPALCRPHFTALVSGFCLLALVFGPAPAQSFFTARGLGELALPADARISALGTPEALSYGNPGIVVYLPKVSFTGSSLGVATIGSQTGQNRLIQNVRPAGFHAAAPLPLETRLMLGIDERFNQDYSIWSESLPDSSCRYHVTGRGGIYALRCGIGWSCLKLAGIGIEYSRLLGSSREDWRFETKNGRYVSTDTVELDYSGDAIKFGASLQTNRFALATHYSLPHCFTARSFRKVHGVIEDSLRTYRISIPSAASFGVSFSPAGQLTIALGFKHQPWHDIKVDTGHMPGALNSYRVSAGAEYLTGKIPLRLGYSYSPWYYAARDASPIIEHGFHLGAGIPITGSGSLEFSAGLNRRNSATLSETSIRLMLSLAYHEAWLRRTRRWGY